MDQAKAIINLKEGIVQLEGPVEFVRHYLELYRSAITGSRGEPSPTVPTPTKEAVARAAAPVRRKRTAAKRATCADAIRAELESGFFGQPKSTQEVKQQLLEKGVTCKDNSIRMNLTRLAQRGLLAPVKKGRAIRYRRTS